MARARASKGEADEARFQVYDAAVLAVLRGEGIDRVPDGQVENVAALVLDWMERHGSAYAPSTRTIRRHLFRLGRVGS